MCGEDELRGVIGRPVHHGHESLEAGLLARVPTLAGDTAAYESTQELAHPHSGQLVSRMAVTYHPALLELAEVR